LLRLRERVERLENLRDEISDRACARLLHDLHAAAQLAALAFVAADAAFMKPLIGKQASIYLPAGSGCFAGNVIGGRTA
jgi:hypothetical protein